MHDVNSFLSEWFIIYLKNKDSVKKEIISIHNNEKDNFTVHLLKQKIYCVVKPILDIEFVNLTAQDKPKFVITLNNYANVNFIARGWDSLVRFKSLKIFLINPFSLSDKLWILSPHFHSKVCDNSSLVSGLKSLSESVTQIYLKELENKIKSSEGEFAL